MIENDLISLLWEVLLLKIIISHHKYTRKVLLQLSLFNKHFLSALGERVKFICTYKKDKHIIIDWQETVILIKAENLSKWAEDVHTCALPENRG